MYVCMCYFVISNNSTNILMYVCMDVFMYKCNNVQYVVTSLRGIAHLSK